MHLEPIRERIAEAALRAGRDPAGISIVAVTKGHPVTAVGEAVAAGLLDIGENKVQEALEKMNQWQAATPAAAGRVRWHLIGHLQRNKAKHAVGRFALIHSVDSVRLADELEKQAGAKDLVQDVLVQVNVAREAQKSGVSPDEAEELIEYVRRLAHLRLCGLMTMAPLTDDKELVRATFRGLRSLSERCAPSAHEPRSTTADPWHLSMGMSSDYTIAVEEGATLLRLGTVLFGERV